MNHKFKPGDIVTYNFLDNHPRIHKNVGIVVKICKGQEDKNFMGAFPKDIYVFVKWIKNENSNNLKSVQYYSIGTSLRKMS